MASIAWMVRSVRTLTRSVRASMLFSLTIGLLNQPADLLIVRLLQGRDEFQTFVQSHISD